MNFETIDSEKTKPIAENVEIVLVVRLTLIEQPNLQLLLPLVGWAIISLLHDFRKLILSIAMLVIIRIKDKIVVVEVLVKNVLTFRNLVPALHRVEIVIVKLTNQLLQFLSVLVKMDVGNLSGTQTLCHPFSLLPLLLSLFLQLVGILVLTFNCLHLLCNSVDLILHGILLLYHLSLK
jgi:hypothetical protein